MRKQRASGMVWKARKMEEIKREDTIWNWAKIEGSHLLICLWRKLPLVRKPWRHSIFISVCLSNIMPLESTPDSLSSLENLWTNPQLPSYRVTSGCSSGSPTTMAFGLLGSWFDRFPRAFCFGCSQLAMVSFWVDRWVDFCIKIIEKYNFNISFKV